MYSFRAVGLTFKHWHVPLCMPDFVFKLFQIHRPRHSSVMRAELSKDCSWRVLEISASETLRFICLLMSNSALFTWVWKVDTVVNIL